MTGITVTDLFCGAGGSSEGASQNAGVEIRTALNHWKRAIETHNTNFPDTLHECTDISVVDPRRYPHTDVLIASPECFPAGTLILTTKGVVPIEEVQVGDLVLTHQNRWMPVTHTMNTVRDTVILRGQGHRSLEVSADHPFYVRQQTQKWNNAKRDYDRRLLAGAEWVAAKHLKTNSYRWSSPSRIPLLPIPPIQGANNRSVEFSPEFWWMVGRWLGDGTVRLREKGFSGEVTICCGKHKVDDLEAALAFAPRTTSHAARTEIHWRKREIRTAYLFEATHDSLAVWLVENFNAGAHEKRLPAWAIAMRRDWREALLAGYVSADGYTNSRYTAAASVSKRLALGIRMLVTGLGYHPTFGAYVHKGGVIEGRPFDAYDLWTVRWENNQSQRTGINDGEHSWTLVKGVETGRHGVTVYNLSVAEDESYVADGIVVHNCTNHSLAKGVKRVQGYTFDLFNNPILDPADERSRATMWDVVRFAEVHKYQAVIVENVVDARRWILFEPWLQAMHALGYDHESVYLNSMFAHPTPQSRDRMYVVFWKRGNKRPNLRFEPRAHCPHCVRDVDAQQSWKNGKTWGKYGKRNQYLYTCPTCRREVQPYYFAAANAIDWSDIGTRIGDRKNPLKPRTLERIEYGLKKFGAKAMSTQTGSRLPALITPFITSQYNGRNPVREVNEPIPTISTFNNQHQLVIPPFILELYNTSNVREITEALGTIPTVGHHGLVQAGTPAIDDCHFRMLTPAEIKRGMAFPDSYVITGNQREQIRQSGNAVTPPAMRMLVERIVETLQ